MQHGSLKLLSLLSFSLLTCSRAPSLLVSIDRLPPMAMSLQIFVTTSEDGGTTLHSTAEDITAFNLPSPTPMRTSLVLDLPSKYTGQLGVSVAVFDKPEAQGCILRLGHKARDFAPTPLDDSVTVTLDIDANDTECSGKVPRLLSISPTYAQTQGGGAATVFGWGFKPGTQVDFGGTISPKTEYRSAFELRPTIPLGNACSMVPIRVSNPSRGVSDPSLLFRYHYSALSYEKGVIGITEGLSAAFYGRIDSDQSTDFVTTPYQNNTNLIVYRKALGISGIQELLVGNAPTPAVLTDLDKDGDLDIVSSDRASGQVVTFLNDGTGLYGVGQFYVSGAGVGPTSIGDLNGDGYPDVVVANETARTVSIFLNDRKGRLGVPSSLAVTNGTNPFRVALTHATLDDKLDLAFADRVDGNLKLVLNQGGTLPTDDSLALKHALGGPPGPIVQADLDGDGLDDLILPIETKNSVRVFFSGNRMAYIPREIASCTAPRAVGVSDVDCDGRADLIIGCNNGAKPVVSFMLQKPGGVFVEGYSTPLSAEITDIQNLSVGDASDDGSPDVIVSSSVGVGYLVNMSQ